MIEHIDLRLLQFPENDFVVAQTGYMNAAVYASTQLLTFADIVLHQQTLHLHQQHAALVKHDLHMQSGACCIAEQCMCAFASKVGPQAGT